jgi:ribosome recycling factor
MSNDPFFKDVEAKMQKCVDACHGEFTAIRTGRANAALLDRITVEAYGQPMPLKQLAGVSTPDARTIVITAWDKNVVGDIKKAIEKSDLGVTPNVDGTNVRLQLPPLTEDRRKDLVKVVKKKAEDGRVAVRNVRHHAHDDVKSQLKRGDITEDDNKRMTDQLQKLTDKYVKDIDALSTAKEKEIMEI